PGSVSGRASTAAPAGTWPPPSASGRAARSTTTSWRRRSNRTATRTPGGPRSATGGPPRPPRGDPPGRRGSGRPRPAGGAAGAGVRRAAELAPDAPEVLDRVVEGLCQEGSADEARRLLLAARFRNARDARFQRLWTDFRFRQLHEEQEAARRAAPVSREADSE